MTIHTYYEPMGGGAGRDAKRILQLWRDSWLRWGWEVSFVERSVAERSPLYAKLWRKIEKLPMMNHPDYEHACFRRWFAMSVLGGWMSDWDCLCNGLTAEMVQPRARLTVCQGHVPALVNGPAAEYGRICELFAGFKVKQYKDWLKEHSRGGSAVSDMLILANHPEEFDTLDLVRQRDSEDWLTAKVIHYANGSLKGMPRVERIKQDFPELIRKFKDSQPPYEVGLV